MIKEISDFLNTPLPVGWSTYTLEERRAFWNNPTLTGEFTRQRVCVAEIWQELYSRDISELTSEDRQRIEKAIEKIPYWEKRSAVNAGAIYGYCRGYAHDILSEQYDKIRKANKKERN